jgi:hypothetical protein
LILKTPHPSFAKGVKGDFVELIYMWERHIMAAAAFGEGRLP